MIRDFFIIISMISILSWCISCDESHDNEPKSNDSLPDLDTIPQIDSTTIYPLCIRDTTKALTSGCRNMYFARVLSLDIRGVKEKVVTVSIDPKLITVTNFCQTFEFPQDGIDVKYIVVDKDTDKVYYESCSETTIPPDKYGTPLVDSEVLGLLSIASSIDTVKPESDFFYISAELMNIEFDRGDNNDSTIQSILFNEILQTEF